MASIRDWVDERTGYRSLLHALVLLNFPVTRAAHWRYVWGGALALLFVVELVTGTLLMTVYSPSEAAAWGSVQYLENEILWGGYIRGVHHATSHMMVLLIVLHGLTVIVTAGYRRPKEFTYWTGLLLAGLVLALAITGNPLPWDQKGYWAYQIETGIAGTMPVIGPALKTLLIGGSEFGNLTLTRLYTVHVIVLPVLASLLLLIHVALMRREKLRLLRTLAERATDSSYDVAAMTNGMEPYWPNQIARNLFVFTGLMALIVAQVVIYPRLADRGSASKSDEWEADLPAAEIKLQAPADREIPYTARPEWFVRCLFELRHKVDKSREVLITGALPAAILLVLCLIPFFETVMGRQVGHIVAIAVSMLGVIAASWLTLEGYLRDYRDADFQQARQRELNYAGRAMWLARENGIPPEGPTTLLHGDAKARGPLLFAAYCAACHSWNGHDATGRITFEVVDGERRPSAPIGADLAGFGTRDWIASFLARPNDPRFFGHADRVKGGERLKNGEMAKWTAENIKPEGPLTEQHLQAVATLLAREADRRDLGEIDPQVLAQGVGVFSGDVTNDKGETLEFAQCLQCHALKAGDPDGLGAGGVSPAPDLNGYGSRQWLKDFIRNPGDKRFYGKKNIMPAFDDSRLSERDLDLLVHWMRGEWQRPKAE